jgi:hypothetical protein
MSQIPGNSAHQQSPLPLCICNLCTGCLPHAGSCLPVKDWPCTANHCICTLTSQSSMAAVGIPTFLQHTASECSSNADRTHSLSSPRGRGWPGGCKHARWCAPCGGCRCSGAAPVAAAACAAAAQLRMQSPGPTGRGCPAAAPAVTALSGCPLPPVLAHHNLFQQIKPYMSGGFLLDYSLDLSAAHRAS